ncbi:MAG: hypothetical protein E5V85_03490 [Mesorhizobium sp.]|nr:MAG: hypothetical protein E5V85_03490 [Mesorhizobium sp.]
MGKTVASAWPLFVAAWFPCFLTTLCLAVLTLILFVDPEQVPTWLLSRGFAPRTWLSAVVAAPFSAMVFAFVLDRMANAPEHGHIVVRRGIERVKRFAIPGVRFELGQRILLAALVLAAVQLFCGFAVAGEHRLFVAGLLATHDQPLSPEDVASWAMARGVFNMLVGGFILAWAYLFVGDFLWTGSFDPVGCWRALDGNRLRFVAIMFIVFAVVAILKYGLGLAVGLILIPADGASPSFLNLMLMHFGLAWPFDVLHLVLSAATVGTILGAFRPSAVASNWSAAAP